MEKIIDKLLGLTRELNESTGYKTTTQMPFLFKITLKYTCEIQFLKRMPFIISAKNVLLIN